MRRRAKCISRALGLEVVDLQVLTRWVLMSEMLREAPERQRCPHQDLGEMRRWWDMIQRLADTMILGELLQALQRSCGPYELLDHWTQGEFHHDVVLRAENVSNLPGPVLVVSTNCNGGIKEVLCLDEPPDRGGLWKMRCPDSDEFSGPAPRILAVARTQHWFDPCELLADDARSELQPKHRRRQKGGGWEQL